MADIATIINTVGSTIGILKSTTTDLERNKALSEVYQCLIDGQRLIMATEIEKLSLLKRTNELEQEIVQFKNWDAQAANYTLKNVGALPGVFAYVYTPTLQGVEPRHWCCTNCFGQRRKSILQYVHGTGYRCPECATEIEPWAAGNVASIDSAYV